MCRGNTGSQHGIRRVHGHRNLDAPDAAFQGPSLRPLIDGSSDAELSPVRSEVRFIVLDPKNVLAEKVAFKHALIDGRHKLIKDFREQSYELYDLERDPGERENLASSRPELLQTMLAALNRTQHVDPASPAGDENAALDPKEGSPSLEACVTSANVPSPLFRKSTSGPALVM